jgi:hypothetical protein
MTKSREDLAAEVRAAATQGNLSCEKAMELAERLSVSSQEVGKAADDAGVRLSSCQLGLFGVSAEKAKVQAASTVSDALRAAIDSRLVEGKLPCAAAWAIAASQNLSRQEVAAACEGLNLKISKCQLGAF